uniref:SRCR domain-containing protein n=1 Tax=Anolis carolinensis TaxID=28377 RepID=A0A803T3H1_ANOCA
SHKYIRLMNGTNPCSGRVEVFYNDTWGTICDAGWDLEDAEVVCRELGCGKPFKALGGAHYGQGSGPIWLESINCRGIKASLKECQKGGWGEHNCSHSQDASVQCSGTCLSHSINLLQCLRNSKASRVGSLQAVLSQHTHSH